MLFPLKLKQNKKSSPSNCLIILIEKTKKGEDKTDETRGVSNFFCQPASRAGNKYKLPARMPTNQSNKYICSDSSRNSYQPAGRISLKSYPPDPKVTRLWRAGGYYVQPWMKHRQTEYCIQVFRVTALLKLQNLADLNQL